MIVRPIRLVSGRMALTIMGIGGAECFARQVEGV
jgi:hypothetical protein